MEYVDIYTAQRERTGRIAQRGSELGEGEYRLIVHAVIFNRAGEMLIQQRQPFKKGWGG
jgi:isopentenyldiphosphate isomerase